MAQLELSEQELTLALEEALAKSSAAIDRLERGFAMWIAERRKYVVARDISLEDVPIFDLTRAIFYSEGESQSGVLVFNPNPGQKGWVVCLSEATRMTLTEADTIAEQYKGTVFEYKQTKSVLEDFYQQQEKLRV